MAKLDALFEVQLGSEKATDSFGTKRPSTVKLMGVEDLTITPLIGAEVVNELRGELQPGYRAYVHRAGGEAVMTGQLEFDDFPYLLAALGSSDSGTTDATANVAYTWNAPCEAADADVTRYTLMKTDRVDDFSLISAVLTNLTVEGESGGPVTYEATFQGQKVTTDKFVALADRVTIPVLGHMGQLFIDVASDATGTTEVTNNAFSFSWNVETNRKLLTHIGSLNPNGFIEGKWGGSLSLSVEADTDTYPILEAIMASTSLATERNVRLQFTAASDSILRLDMSGPLLEAPEIYSDEDGVVTFDFEITGGATTASTSFAGAYLFSTVATID
jgi:hypothetical protein